MLTMVLVAAIGGSGGEPANVASAANLPIYRSVSDIAARTCQSPQDVGWTWNVNGDARATVNVDRFKQVLGSGGLTLGGGGNYARWSGPLQKDVGAALASRNDCAEKVFVAMIDHLPLTDSKTGKSVPKPAQPHQAYRAAAPATTVTATDSNNSNGAGQQLIAGAQSTNFQVAGPTATGGAAIQYVNIPPVTPDQKQQAHDALLADLAELARYPERNAIELGPSIIQRHFNFKAPRALYLLLAKYTYPTIASVPGGEELNRYEADYYNFENTLPAFEQSGIEKVGEIVAQKQPYVWRSVFEYCVLRAAGATATQLVSANGQPSFGVTPEQEEAIFLKLYTDPKFGPNLKAEADFLQTFTNRAYALLRPFRAN